MAGGPVHITRVGPYRREIRITARVGVARAEMGDDLHHFAIELRHHAGVITAATADSIRVPWTTCPAAALALTKLAGKPVVSPLPFAAPHERFENCTHMLDLANLAAGRAHQPGFERTYRVAVDVAPDRTLTGSLVVDGRPSLAWRIAGGRIESDDEFDGRVPGELPRLLFGRAIDRAEPVLVMRRAMHIGASRTLDLDALESPLGGFPVPPSCHTYLPGVRELARRERGTFIDFFREGRWPLDGSVSGG